MSSAMYEVQVPEGVRAGQAFQAEIGGVLMLITCPEGITPGMLIQVAGASTEVPTVAGVPVGAASPAGVAAGVAVGSPPPNMVMMGDASHMMPEVSYVEVDEISPAGWLCLIVGCFACPGLNLLGLCMRERRLVPVTQLAYAY